MAALVQPEIRADGVTLRPWLPSDRPAVVSAFADPAIQCWHCRSMNDDEARDCANGTYNQRLFDLLWSYYERRVL